MNHKNKTKLAVQLMLGFILLSLPASTGWAVPQRSPFGIEVALKPGVTPEILDIHFTLPHDCILYPERLHFQNEDGDDLTPLKIPDPVTEVVPATGKEKKIYEQSFSAQLALSALANSRLVVKFQGCSNDTCFFPEKRIFALTTNAQSVRMVSEVMDTKPPAEATYADWTRQISGFKVAAQESGYISAKKFISFLDRAKSGDDSVDDPLARFKKAGLTATLFLIVLGGILLNLTPCILPMIPINLAIIGAGSAAASRMTGFKNGAVYGAGMALAYSVLGLGVVLTGSKFGTINSSVWFNVIIAVVFFVLALGMFDAINIDFSRFSGNLGPQKAGKEKGSLIHHIVIFIMGVMAALLAGACVAPVVISVMLLATSIYAKGQVAGLLLPCLLGAGMALPWPFAGAGLTFLPKPGKWMKRVKQGFGVLIVLFGVYYAHLAVNAFESRQQDTTLLASAPAGAAARQGDANAELAAALDKARQEGRPVLVDFHASWCKNCLAMDETVFNQAEVKKRFEDFIVVRYDAERPGESPAKDVLDHFGVMGLPTYLVLTANK